MKVCQTIFKIAHPLLKIHKINLRLTVSSGTPPLDDMRHDRRRAPTSFRFFSLSTGAWLPALDPEDILVPFFSHPTDNPHKFQR